MRIGRAALVGVVVLGLVSADPAGAQEAPRPYSANLCSIKLGGGPGPPGPVYMGEETKELARAWGCAAGDIIDAMLEPRWAEQVDFFVASLCDFRQQIMVERTRRPLSGGDGMGAKVRCAYIGHTRGLAPMSRADDTSPR